MRKLYHQGAVFHWKKLLLTVGVMLSVGLSIAQCNYTLNLHDSYGDGWNGNTIDVTVGTTTTNHTIPSGQSLVQVALQVNPGDLIEVNYLGGGSYNYEVSFELEDPIGTIVYSSGTNPVVGVHYSSNGSCPTCIPATDLVFQNITETSADLSWVNANTSIAQIIEYGVAGFTPGTGTTVQQNTNSYSFSGLLNNQDYDVYVSIVCSVGDTTSAVLGTFKTLSIPCAAITPVSLPFNQGFENNNLSNIGSHLSIICDVDQSWEFETDDQIRGEINLGPNHVSDGYNSQGALVMTNNASTNPDVISASILTLDLTNYASSQDLIFDFYYSNRNNANDSGDSVWVRGSNTDSWINLLRMDGFSWSDDWKYSGLIDLDSVLTNNGQSISATTQFKFGMEQGSYYGGTDGMMIDEVSVYEQACRNPYNVEALDITANSATITWEPGAFETEWSYQVVPEGGFIAPYSLTTTTNSISATGLQPETTYWVYVRSACSPSDWVGPYEFTTGCGVYTPTYEEKFSDWAPHCWQEAVGPLSNSTVLTYQNSNWLADGFANNGSTGAARLNIYSTNLHHWLISPIVDMGSALMQYELTYNVAATEFANSTTDAIFGVDDTLAVVISYDGGVTWNLDDTLVTYHAGNNPGVAGFAENFSLQGVFGEIAIGFYGTSTLSNEDIDVFVDNFRIGLPTNCFAPENVLAFDPTLDSIYVGWQGVGVATQWVVEYGPTGFALGSGTQVVANSDTIGVGGLNPDTEYEFYVASICGANDTTSFAIPATMRTLPDYCAGSLFKDNGGDDDYLNNSDDTITICSGFANGIVTVNFLSFQTENNYDELHIYDGSDVSATLIGSYSGTNSPGVVTSTNADGCLTFVFESDGSLNYPGWEATVSCLAPVTCNTPTNATLIETTSDSAYITWVAGGSETEWAIEYGPIGFAPGSGSSVVVNNDTAGIGNLMSASNYDFYIRAICGPGDTSYAAVINNVSTRSDYCAGDLFVDNGGDGDYLPNSDDTTVIYSSYAGGALYIEFLSFQMSSFGDELRVYDGEDPNTAQLLATLNGFNVPNDILVSNGDGAVSFVFESNTYTNYDGWEAQITCMPPITCFAPLVFTATPMGVDSLDLAWINGGGETMWETRIVYEGEDVDASNAISNFHSVNMTDTLTGLGLEAYQDYDIYIRSICGAGDSSVWFGPVNFSTSGNPFEDVGIYSSNVDGSNLCEDEAFIFEVEMANFNAADSVEIDYTYSYTFQGVTHSENGVTEKIAANDEVEFADTLDLSGGGILTIEFVTVNTGDVNAVNDTLSYTINVDEYFASTLADTIIGCNDPYLMLDAGMGADAYQWSTGTTGTTESVSENGNYTVQITNGACISLEEVSVWISELSYDLGDDVEVCDNFNISEEFTYNSALALTPVWNGTDTTHTYVANRLGVHTVMIQDVYGCTITESVSLVEAFEVGLDDSLSFCEGSSVYLSTTATGSYQWSTGSSNSVIQVTEEGMYVVTVTSAAGCIIGDSTYVTENLLPEIIAAQVDSVDGYDVYFSSDVTSGDITWDFGDGATSTDQDPVHTYAQSGTYNVTLTVTNDCGMDVEVVEVPITVSVADVNGGIDYAVFPNPSNGVFNLTLDAATAVNYELKVMDMNGKVIYQELPSTVVGNTNKEINLNVSKGVYLMHLITADKVQTVKLIVK